MTLTKPDLPEQKTFVARLKPISDPEKGTHLRISHWPKRVPVITQMEATECGAACLAMALNYYGRKTALMEVRERCGVGREGLSALSLVKAAQSYGLEARGMALQKNDFRYIPLPAIIHWQFKHYLVLESWTAQEVRVVDPAAGRARMSAAEFEAGFTGVVITLEPGPTFERSQPSPQITAAIYLKELFKIPGLIAQILAASLVLQLLGLGLPLLTKVAVDQIIPFGLRDILGLVVVGMALLLATQFVTALLRAFLLVHLQARIDIKLLQGFFVHLLKLPYHFFQQRASGDLLSRLGSNFTIREALTGQLISMVLDSGLVIIYLAVLFWQAPLFGIVVLGLGLAQVAMLLLTSTRLHDLTRQDLAAQSRTQAYLAEVLAGIATVKASGAEQRVLKRWTNLFNEQLNLSVRRNYLLALSETALLGMRNLPLMVLLWVGTSQVLKGNMTIGTMLALNSLAVSCLMPLTNLVNSGQRLQLVRSHFERIADVLAVAPEQEAEGLLSSARLSGQIEIRNLDFRYSAEGPLVLHNINLAIQPGQKVALVGPSGSGKSTLARLLLGLYQPISGEIWLDGQPLPRYEYRAVRRQFGVVLQETGIFNGSIRDNITFHQPELAFEQVIVAASAAGLHEDIIRLPMGYETLVSEGGSALSGGQRQRLALARALAHHPAILLLDEATSHLDVLTEKLVEQNLDELQATRIVIAHRLSTIRNAGLIVVLDKGVIVEQGTHHELLARRGYYARLVESQLESYTQAERG